MSPANSIYVRQLAPAVFRLARRGKVFMFSLTVDDSADSKRKKIFVVGGFLGDSEEWFEVERHWEARVKDEGLSYFRATECYSLTGQFVTLVKKYGAPEARVRSNALLKDLKLIVKASNLQAFCLGILMDDYCAVRREPGAGLVLPADPYLYAHEQLIYGVARVVCASPNPSPIAFSYDEHNKAAALQNRWAEFKERHPLGAKCMATLMPLDDEQVPAVQIADLFAHTAKRVFESRIDNKLVLQRANSEVELGELKEWARYICRLWILEENYLREIVKASIKAFESGSPGPELIDIVW